MAGETDTTVKVEREDGITWVIMNRPERRNAMSPEMHYAMNGVLSDLEVDPDTGVVVLTGAGDSFSAGQDVQKFFRDLEDNPRERLRAETVELARLLMDKDPRALRATKQAVRMAQTMDYMRANDYLTAKNVELNLGGGDRGRDGFRPYLDEYSHRSGHTAGEDEGR